MLSPEEVISFVEAMVEDILKGSEYELVDVTYTNEGRGWFLRIFIDKEGGITLDDCQKLHSEIGQHLDVEDPISHRYYLEISSPGLDRPLKKDRDFLRYQGRKIKIKTKLPLEGRRNFTGELLGLNNGKVSVKLAEGDAVDIGKDNLASAKLLVDIDV
jgi:ribosome maturation factor RimP